MATKRIFILSVMLIWHRENVGGDAYTANVVRVKESDSTPWKKYYLCRDRLGSVTMVLDSLGNAVQNVSYDAWGNLRNPQTHALYTESDMPTLFLERGFTGHEHLPEFGLINMNARLYDPVLGRFLSPDPYVQMPDNSQNFNRYSYCLNNPLKYVDSDGEVWWIPIVVGAAIGAYAGASIQSETAAFWNWKSNAWQGAIAGGIVGAAVGYAFAGAIHASGMTMVTNETIISSKVSGIVGSMVNSGAINVSMNAIFKGGWDGAWKAGVAGLATGAWASTGGFGMVNAWGVKNTFAQLGGKLGYQMIGTSLGSIGSNWAAGRGIFSRVTLGLGPVNLTIGKGEHLFQWKNNIGNLGMNAFGFINTIMGGKVSFDWKNLSINYSGGIIDKMFKPSEFASGFSPHVVTGNSNLINVYMHELHHLWHSRALNDLYLLNYGLQGLNSLLSGNSFLSNGNYYEDFADYYNWW